MNKNFKTILQMAGEVVEQTLENYSIDSTNEEIRENLSVAAEVYETSATIIRTILDTPIKEELH